METTLHDIQPENSESPCNPTSVDGWATIIAKIPEEGIGIAEWITFTDIGFGVFGQYEIRSTGVFSIAWSDHEIIEVSRNINDQVFLARINAQKPLLFPCALASMLKFIDGPAGQIGGRHFQVSDEFRQAAEFSILANNIQSSTINSSATNSSVTHLVSNRKYQLDAEIETARGKATTRNDPHAVWHSLKDMALNCVAPFTGFVSPTKGIEYIDSNGNSVFISKAAFTKRLTRKTSKGR